MAANDLMMRIQLLVQGGRSSAELKRLQSELKSLTASLKTLESTKITPLTRDIGAIQRAAAGLRGVNLNNFTSQIDAVKRAFSGLGLGTTALDDLRAKYQALNRELSSGALNRFQSGLNQSKKDLQDLRTTSIVPLNNELRNLRAQKKVDSLVTDQATAGLKVARAQLALMRDDLKRIPKTDTAGRDTQKARIDALNRSILEGNKSNLEAQRAILNASESVIRSKAKDLALEQGKQASLNNQIQGLNQQVAAQKAKEQSIKREIQELTRLNTAQANARKLQLQTDLAGAKGTRTDLRSQIRDTQDAAKAELRRIQATEAGTRSLNRQGGALTSLGRQFLSTTGIIRQFGSAVAFAFGPQALGLVAAFKVVDFAAQFFQANKEIENLNRGLNALTGGSADLYFSELVKAANTTGQSLHVVTDSFLQLVAASKGTRLEGAATREIFQSVSQALVITGADAVRSRRAFLALAQMMSKGQVFAEELRQQLSEALPGAVQIFARALNVNPQEMFDLMQQGRISSEALILFAQQLQQEMPALSEDLFTFSQKAALLQNSVRLLFKEVGDTGIWDAFGDGLLRARNLVDSFRSNIGGVADAIKGEFRFSAELFDLSGLGEISQGAFGILGDTAEYAADRIYRLYDAVRLGLAEGLIRIGNAAGELNAAFGGDIQTESWLDQLKDLDVRALDFLVEKAGLAAQGVSDLFSGTLEGKLNIDLETAQRNLKLIEEQARLTREEFERLTFFDRLSATGPTPVEQSQKGFKTYEEYLAIVEKVAQAERASLAEIQRRIALQQQQKKAGEEILGQVDQLSKDREFIKLFDPKERETLNNLREATINLQRVQEDALRINKENERSLLNRIKQTNSVWGIERDILATIRRAREVEAERIGDRNKDAMDSLKLELDRAKAIEQSEKNAKDLGFGYDPERSKQEFRAYQLRQKAQKELEAAARSTNAEERKGFLERAQFLIEESNQLNLQAGRTFALKQGYDQLKKIQEQLSAVKEREAADELKLAELQNIRTKAAEAYANATDQSGKLTGAERTEWAKVADAILKAQVALEADLGFGQNAIEAEKLRKTLDDIVQTDVGKIETRINKALQERTQASFEDLKTALEEYKKERAALLALRADLIAQGAGQPGATDLLNKELDDINRRIGQEDQRLKALRDNFADAKLDPAAKLPDLTFPVLLAEMSPEELKKIQDAADQRKIELETQLKSPESLTVPTALADVDKEEVERVTQDAQNKADGKPVVIPTTVQKPKDELPLSSSSIPVEVDVQPITQEQAKSFWKNLRDLVPTQDDLFGSLNPAVTTILSGVAENISTSISQALSESLNVASLPLPPIEAPLIKPELDESGSAEVGKKIGELFLRGVDSLSLGIEKKLSELRVSSLAPYFANQGRIGAIEFNKNFESILEQAWKVSDVGISETNPLIRQALQLDQFEIALHNLLNNDLLQEFEGNVGVKVFMDSDSKAKFIEDFVELARGAARIGLDQETGTEFTSFINQTLSNIRVIPILDDKFLVLFSKKIDEMKAKGREIDPFFYLDKNKIQEFFNTFRDLMDQSINPDGGLQTQININPQGAEAVSQVFSEIKDDAYSITEAISNWTPPSDLRRLFVSTNEEQILRETAALDRLAESRRNVSSVFIDTASINQNFKVIETAANRSAEQTKELFDTLKQPVRSQVFLDFRDEGRIQYLENWLKELQSTQPQISVGAIADTQQIQFVKNLLINEYSKVPASIKPTVDQAAAQQAKTSISNTIKAIPVNLLPPITVGITPDLDRAKVAEQSQALRTAFQQQGVTINVDVVADKDEITGVEKTLNRLTATDRRIEISARTELLDRELQRIDSQFQEFNRTAGAGLTPGFQAAGAQAQQFGALVDQVNLKMRETQRIAGLADTEVKSLLDQRKAIEYQVKLDRKQADDEAKKFQEETQRLLTDPDPIRLIADPSQLVEAQRLIGEVQSDLQKLKDAGATNIEVRLDKDTGQLVVTADTSQADASVNAIIARIENSNVVLRVKVVYDDPGFKPGGSSTTVAKRRWGGPISGYGGGDKVRALLEPGEFVLRKEAARALGLERLMKLNRMGHQALSSFKTPRMDASHIHVPRFAEGGAVGGQPIIINVPGSQPIRVSGSRDQATALANLLARTGRAL